MSTRAFVVSTIMLIALSMPIGVSAQDDEGAMTAAEHATAAQGYQAEAKQAQEHIAEHERMLQRYRSFTMSPKAANLPKGAMIRHCQKLIDGYKQVASQAGDLAKIHGDLASGAQEK